MLENRSATLNAPSTSRARRDEPPSRQRAKRTNDPFSGLSKNTAEGRRVCDLLRGFLRAMDDPTDVVLQADALRAAELTVATESARAKLLAGDGDVDKVVRLEGMAARSVRRLGLDRKRAPAGPSLAEYLASRRKAHDENASPDDELAEEAGHETSTSELADGSAEAVG